MTYDLYMFKVEKGQSVIEAAEALFRKWDDEYDSEVEQIVTSEDRVFIDHLASTLHSRNPNLTINPVDYRGYHVGVYCDSDPNEETGLINIHKDYVDVSVGYGADPEQANRTMLNILINLKILQSETGYAVYDPQSRKEVNLDHDIADLLGEYAHGTAITDDIVKRMKKGLI
jgi:hypothetical protein